MTRFGVALLVLGLSFAWGAYAQPVMLGATEIPVGGEYRFFAPGGGNVSVDDESVAAIALRFDEGDRMVDSTPVRTAETTRFRGLRCGRTFYTYLLRGAPGTEPTEVNGLLIVGGFALDADPQTPAEESSFALLPGGARDVTVKNLAFETELVPEAGDQYAVTCEPGLILNPSSFELSRGTRETQFTVIAEPGADPGVRECQVARVSRAALRGDARILEPSDAEVRKTLTVLVADPFAIPVFPGPGLYTLANPVRTRFQGAENQLEELGYDPDGPLFEIIGTGQQTRMIFRFLGMTINCNLVGGAGTCNGVGTHEIDVVFQASRPLSGEASQAAPGTTARILFGTVLGNQFAADQLEGTVVGVGDAAERIVVAGEGFELDKLGGFLEIPVVDRAPGSTPVTVTASEAVLVPLSDPTPNEATGAEQAATEGVLTSELTLAGGGRVGALVGRSPAGADRTIDVEIGPHAVTIAQDGLDSERPAIAPFGVVEGATFSPGITSSGWTSILGDFSIETTRTWGDDDFVATPALRKEQGAVLLPTALDGVSVTVGGTPAFVQFISDTQLNVLIDDDEQTGFVDVVVTTPNGVSLATQAFKAPLAPQFFRFDPNGRIYIAAVHLDRTFVGPENLFGVPGASRPAVPGDRVLLFGSGWGPTDPPRPAGQLVAAPAALANEFEITIGGVETTVEFAGIVGSGLYQFNVIIPQLEAGDHEVVASVGGVGIGTAAFLTIGSIQ